MRAVLPRAVARIAPAAVLHARANRRTGCSTPSAIRLRPGRASDARRAAAGRRRAAPDRRRLVPRISATAPPKSRSPSTIVPGQGPRHDAARAARRRSAAAHGFRRFEATTLAENAAMLEVFRESGLRNPIEVRAAAASTVRCRSTRRRSRSPPRSAARPLATVASLRPLLEPARVAVIGASRDPDSIGRRILDALVAAGFTGADLSGQSEGRRARRPALLSVDRRRCRAASISAIIAVPRGRGARRRRRLRRGRRQVAGRDHARASPKPATKGARCSSSSSRRCAGYGMRMVGPNCMGLLNTAPSVRLNASFSPIVPPAGHVGLLVAERRARPRDPRAGDRARRRPVDVRQRRQQGRRVGQRSAASTGKADPHTAVILLYLESFGNPRRFARLARRIGRTKPIVAVKAGRTRAGSRAAGSHTAALAASDTAVDALFHQSGVIRADTIDEMFDIAACLDAQPLPAGRRVAIVTNAGGPGILAVDACEAAGLDGRAVLRRDARSASRRFCRAEASVGNPVDMVASAGPDEYRRAIEVALAADDSRRADRHLHAGRSDATAADTLDGDPRRHRGRRAAPARRASRSSPA